MCLTASDRRGLVHALTREAQIARDQGKGLEALDIQRRALAHASEVCADEQLARVVRHLADTLAGMERHGGATCLYEEMTALYCRGLDAPRLERANAIRSVACHEGALGNRDRAISFWRELRERYAALDDVFKETYGLSNDPGGGEADRRLARLSAS